jgi:hypothetical protein
MRTTSPKPFIALLALALTICGQIAWAQNSQTPPPPQPAGTAQPSSLRQVRQDCPGSDVASDARDIGKGTSKGPGVAASGVGNGVRNFAALPLNNTDGHVAKAAAVAGKLAGIGAAGLLV